MPLSPCSIYQEKVSPLSLAAVDVTVRAMIGRAGQILLTDWQPSWWAVLETQTIFQGSAGDVWNWRSETYYEGHVWICLEPFLHCSWTEKVDILFGTWPSAPQEFFLGCRVLTWSARRCLTLIPPQTSCGPLPVTSSGGFSIDCQRWICNCHSKGAGEVEREGQEAWVYCYKGFWLCY